MEEIPVFRAAKRRKFTRPREEIPLDSVQQPAPLDASGNLEHHDDDNEDEQRETEAGVSNLIRARKHVRRGVTGVQFSTAKAARETDPESSRALVPLDDSLEKAIDITSRFVGGTGQVVNVDKHMVAFVDSELARRRNIPVSSTLDLHSPRTDDLEDDLTAPYGSGIVDQKPPSTNPAAARQLAEVDLGDFAHERNLARTQAALERVKAGQVPIEDEIKPPKPRKPRLGRDGKPMRPRPKKGRDSEDVARDALVEQFLHENKIDMYETGTPEPRYAKETDRGSGHDADADERFAEQFRQEFMDAMAERRNKTKPAPPAKGVAVPEPKGPKLGGSRSARAKMAQIQQQQQPGSGKK